MLSRGFLGKASLLRFVQIIDGCYLGSDACQYLNMNIWQQMETCSNLLIYSLFNSGFWMARDGHPVPQVRGVAARATYTLRGSAIFAGIRRHAFPPIAGILDSIMRFRMPRPGVEASCPIILFVCRYLERALAKALDAASQPRLHATATPTPTPTPAPTALQATQHLPQHHTNANTDTTLHHPTLL